VYNTHGNGGKFQILIGKCEGRVPRGKPRGKVKVKFSLYRPWRPLGLREVETHIFRHSAHRLRQGRHTYVPAAFYSQENYWFSFLLEAESTPGRQCGWKD
jgi:hypothetical protein